MFNQQDSKVKNVTNIAHLPDGRIDISRFDPERLGVIMECSDACGCSPNCPRRGLQKLQQKEWIVFHNGIEWTLRTREAFEPGEFICERTGEIKMCPESQSPKPPGIKVKRREEGKLATDSTFIIQYGALDSGYYLDSSKIGNEARFINHSCTPNAAFVEVYSRAREEDVLIPRIGVIALRRIEIGEEITANFNAGQGIPADDKAVPCLCRPNCPTKLHAE